MTPEERQNILDAIKQTDAIFALEGFQPTDDIKTIDTAVLAGRVSFSQAAGELAAYIEKHKTTDGFLESRSWA
jgi:hypothetical protein